VKRKRLHVQLTERQQLIIGFVLVVLVAISLLYCLGFASVALRQAWENSPLQLNGNGTYYFEEEGLDLTPTLPLVEPTDSDAAPY
jgi:hypothetical protein